MSFFKHIQLTQFRNYTLQSFDFDKKIVGISGVNGSGKTNLLDAIYYLCFTKSYFSKPDSKNVQHGRQGFRIEAAVEQQGKEASLTCILRESGRKEFYNNNIQYKKFSEHIGQFSCVMIAPDDASLINGSSEERRKFTDTILAQIYPQYLQYLIDYNRILLQRNSCLKNARNSNTHIEDLLTIFDKQLSIAGQEIYKMRRVFFKSFLPKTLAQYNAIANKEEQLTLSYQSQLHQTPLMQLLEESRQNDLYLQRTTIGIHKDDIQLLMLEAPFKQMASQGQKKSLLFALKLAEYNVLNESKNHSPVLLLDDVFEKLDADRMLNLLKKVCKNTDAQIFITDTHKDRLQEAFELLSVAYQLIEL